MAGKAAPAGAKKTAATAKSQATEKSAPPAKKAASVDLASLGDLLGKQIDLEAEERAKSGQSGLFISIAQGNTKMLKPRDPAFVPGLNLYDFVIPSKKLVLGKEFKCTVLAMCKVYAETVPKGSEGNDTDMDKVVKYWLPDDAEQIPEEAPFTRPLPNGNVLRPQHWVYVYIHGHEDVEGALFGFKSIGNQVYTQLNKLIKGASRSCTELRFTVTQQEIVANGGQTNFYPLFEIDGRNFELDEDTNIPSKTKGGLSEAEIAEVITRSAQIFEDYKNLKIVSRQALPSNGFAPKALPGASYADEEPVAPGGKKPRF
jgi:hypothetical protein